MLSSPCTRAPLMAKRAANTNVQIRDAILAVTRRDQTIPRYREADRPQSWGGGRHLHLFTALKWALLWMGRYLQIEHACSLSCCRETSVPRVLSLLSVGRLREWNECGKGGGKNSDLGLDGSTENGERARVFLPAHNNTQIFFFAIFFLSFFRLVFVFAFHVYFFFFSSGE